MTDSRTQVRRDAATERSEPRWVRCGGCGSVVYGRRMARNLHVCPDCGYHGRLTARQRIDVLLDEGTGKPLDLVPSVGDPLEFTDTIPYPRRLDHARAATGLDEAVVCVRGDIEGHPVIAAVMDFGFLGGSLGTAVGDLIVHAADVALAERTPLLLVTASGGARMQEGALSLMQMARTSRALGRLDEAGILTVSLVTDPTFGGVAASFATLCDVIIAEPGARLGFAGPRVIEQTIKQSLPDGFQTAEFLSDQGLVDAIAPREELRAALARLLSVGGRRGGVLPDAPAEDPLVRDSAALPGLDAWETVRQARDLNRPTTLEYFAAILDTFMELRGDRLSGECPAIVGGLGLLGGTPLVAIGHQKGHSVPELVARSFGMPSPAGYRKAARLIRLAGKLGLPVLTLVDTPGAYPGKEAEEQGQAMAIAENLRLMAGLPVPIVSVITGEGGSGGALALAVANRVLVMSNAVYSVISPEGCAAILWKDASAAPRAARALRVDAPSLLKLGIVDAVIPEPDGGVQQAPHAGAARLRDAVAAAFNELGGLDPDRLVADRTLRFHGIGGDL